jgi:hypothetical protein
MLWGRGQVLTCPISGGRCAQAKVEQELESPRRSWLKLPVCAQSGNPSPMRLPLKLALALGRWRESQNKLAE